MKASILIVDDDQPSLTLLSAIVAKGGYLPLTASDARSALNILKTQTPQLIIQDLSLPDLDGLHLIQCVHRIPKFRNIPVIFLSASSGRIESVRMAHEVSVALLKKPVDVNALLNSINDCLSENTSTVRMRR